MFNRKPKATIAPLLKQWLSELAAGQPLVAPQRQFAPKCAQLQADAAQLKTLSHTPGGPYGNWSYGCRHGA